GDGHRTAAGADDRLAGTGSLPARRQRGGVPRYGSRRRHRVLLRRPAVPTSHMKLLPYVVVDGTTGNRAAAELGSVTVPANRRDPHSSGAVDVSFVRLRGPKSGAQPPIFYLAGGPGGSGIARASAELATYARLAEHADVIMIDP